MTDEQKRIVENVAAPLMLYRFVLASLMEDLEAVGDDGWEAEAVSAAWDCLLKADRHLDKVLKP